MSGYWFPPDDYAPDAHQPSQGSAHSISGAKAEDDPAEKVRRVAEEVTRKSFPRSQRRIGF